MSSWRYMRSGYGSKQADFDIVSEGGGRVASTPYEKHARLIAAAPDLLEPLRAAVAFAEQHDDWRVRHASWIGNARAAIARATDHE